MGKKEKEHRAKVAKRNRKIAQEKYATQKAIERMMERMKQQSSEMDVKVGDESVPFEVLGEADSLLEQQSLDNTEPIFDSAGFTIEDRVENVEPETEG